MKVAIEQKVFERIPGLKVGIVTARNMCIPGDDVARLVKEFLNTCWKDGSASCATYPNVQNHPHVQAWRQCYQSLGISVKKYVSSVESLLKRATKQPDPRSIHPIVDLYNAISIRYVVPFGAFDMDTLPSDQPLLLRHGKAKDQFNPLDAEPNSSPEEFTKDQESEVLYAVGDNVVTRHINWRQSKLGLVQPDSKNVIFMCEILQDHGVSFTEAENGMKELSLRLSEWFDCAPELYYLDQQCPELIV